MWNGKTFALQMFKRSNFLGHSVKDKIFGGNGIWEPPIHKGLGWEASVLKQEEEIAV